MDAQTYLNQHQQLSHLIRHDVDCLEYLNDSLLNIPSPSSSRSSIHASPGEDALYVRTLESIDQKKFELAQKKELMARLENQIGEALDQMRFLNDRWAVDYVMFLRHRFLMHEKWEDVAKAVCVSRATVYRWKDPALDLFPMPADPIDIRKELSALKAA